MPARPALTRAPAALALAVVVVAVAVSACSQPGTQAPRAEAAKVGDATGQISTACGYAEEATAFGGGHAAGLAAIEAMADSGARELAAVYAHDQANVYQGESIGGVVDDSISTLGDCGLTGAQKLLEHALAAHP